MARRKTCRRCWSAVIKDTFIGFQARFIEGTRRCEMDRQKKAVAYYMTARVKQDSKSGTKWYGFPWIAAQELEFIVSVEDIDRKSAGSHDRNADDLNDAPHHFDPYSRAWDYLSDCDWVETNPLSKVRIQYRR